MSSVALGGKVTSVSDDFFAEAYHLLLVEVMPAVSFHILIPDGSNDWSPQPAPSLKGQFGQNGALYSGWESRRHNPTYDWYDVFACHRTHIGGKNPIGV